MDPLEKLTEKNKKHERIKQNERIEVARHLPLITLYIIIYLSIYVFLSVDNFAPNTDSLLGMSKQVWLFAMIISGGFGAILFIGSIASVIWFFLVSSYIEFKRIPKRAILILLLAKVSSFCFFMLGSYLDTIININSQLIAKFMNFGYETTPFLITLPANMFIAGVALIFLKILISIASIPLDAKKHAEKLTALYK
ncbi:hypothetical protein [Pseudoalteromonas luteoviolacea]|uniref:Uncharacterized protein n=1 Tax=Pseudoalteromonas luteoviolacea H33 TaxID=1365251 RepID=A0A167GK16_9GAMM|nr:hypothetical protein [Pseudoalteromonas luteoviolacea]KZN55534.1 hypothetical protein N476_07330 [Pseudoalteromonas luteoviolacea H33]KZN74447.1 hypothetical protein N477_21970 [Pseudoalteromonas luteoviolacea H33-S]MBQ4879799.1 hypothetical protein [Pseudoalteromonas luteoviolacea]MBQ4908897.1 hypothetical protein [Pseudoalteromonas luteoviolacea]